MNIKKPSYDLVKTPRTIVVLFGPNNEHEIIEADTGIAFSTGKLLHEDKIAIYVATSKSDAEAAIAHYGDHATLVDFISKGDKPDGYCKDCLNGTHPKEARQPAIR
jgi:hypothetical protein